MFDSTCCIYEEVTRQHKIASIVWGTRGIKYLTFQAIFATGAYSCHEMTLKSKSIKLYMNLMRYVSTICKEYINTEYNF